ncbi:Outer membrane protein TolC [Lutibacter agarilyticus]|uniref:Outer membrane protein TolC n=1 Tax=Lutibacter agarilyticus TaxID=1109740 RepID=A0A238YBF8_9FLAO|nr:TolC family protein [Lutibacter agarilyticus]SNR67699.1 Outer membrane protein TolC [Lutibacter agarilyticus]
MKTNYSITFISLIVICSFSNAQSLDDYLKIATKNSPHLQSIHYNYESDLEKINELGSIQNTSIGVGYFVSPVETRVGAQKAKFSISQNLPWFGTLNTKQEGAALKANATLNEFDMAKRTLFLQIKTTYYQLYELKSKENIITEHLKLLTSFEELALSELENNRSTMVDVLKIRIEKNELTNSLNTIQENFKAKQITFNLLLNRNKNSEITITKNISINTSEAIFSKEAISTNPKLLQLQNLKASLKKEELATKKEGLPTVGIGLDYVIVEERPAPNIADNGKDIFMPMVSVSIPLFSNKYRSKQKQFQLDQKAIVATSINTTNELTTLFETSESAIKTARTSILTQTQNIAETERIKTLLLAAYETSSIDFKQLLEIQQMKLKFEFKKVGSEKEYAIQKSTLEFLTTTN